MPPVAQQDPPELNVLLVAVILLEGLLILRYSLPENLKLGDGWPDVVKTWTVLRGTGPLFWLNLISGVIVPLVPMKSGFIRWFQTYMFRERDSNMYIHSRFLRLFPLYMQIYIVCWGTIYGYISVMDKLWLHQPQFAGTFIRALPKQNTVFLQSKVSCDAKYTFSLIFMRISNLERLYMTHQIWWIGTWD